MSVVPAVEVVDLVKRYRGRTVVDGVSLTAHAGRVTAVLGPNGAGKTTTVECCEGLRRPDAGSVRVLGGDPLRRSPDVRAQVGVMLQDGGLPPAARAGDLLQTLAGFHAYPLPVPDLLTWLGLENAASTPVRRLSGGQRQRLAFAAAMIGRPAVIFLDEPSAGLDPQSRLVVWEVVERLRTDGAAVVLTTHLMDEAERLADHIVVLDGGRVVTQGAPSDLLGAQGGALTFASAPGVDLDPLQSLLGPGIVLRESGPGRYEAFAEPPTTIDVRVLAVVTGWCAEQGLEVRGLTVRPRTLEDVFLQLTGRELR